MSFNTNIASINNFNQPMKDFIEATKCDFNETIDFNETTNSREMGNFKFEKRSPDQSLLMLLGSMTDLAIRAGLSGKQIDHIDSIDHINEQPFCSIPKTCNTCKKLAAEDLLSLLKKIEKMADQNLINLQPVGLYNRIVSTELCLTKCFDIPNDVARQVGDQMHEDYNNSSQERKREVVRTNQALTRIKESITDINAYIEKKMIK